MYSILHQYPPEYFYVQYYPNIHSYVFFTNIITLLQCNNFLLYVVMVSRTLVKHLTISCFAFFLYLPQNNYTLQALYTELLRLISIIILSNNVHYQYPFPLLKDIFKYFLPWKLTHTDRGIGEGAIIARDQSSSAAGRWHRGRGRNPPCNHLGIRCNLAKCNKM